MTMTPEHLATLLPFCVGTRHIVAPMGEARGGWIDESLNSIDAARRAYDDGVVELCQGRDHAGVYLFAIPRKRPIQGGRPDHQKICRQVLA